MFFRKRKYEGSGSLSRMAWKRFRKNRLSYAALWFILCTVILGALGYQITPDRSPFANDQHIELAAKKPGFSCPMLLITKNEPLESTSWFHTMIFGEKSNFVSIPFNDYRIDGLVLTIDEYSDPPETDPIQYKFELADIAYPLEPGKTVFLSNDTVYIPVLGGITQLITLNDLQEKVIHNHIIKKRYLLGSDRFGRDMLSMLLIGIRVSLSVGFISVLISLIIGITLGALAGFFRGWVDHLIVWFINVIWSIPTLLMVIAITFALGKGFWQIFVAVGLTMWVEVARVVRGQILSFREKEFVEAGKALGFSNYRIIFRHILPNIMGPVVVISSANFASAILIEAGLSFLGIGVQPPMPSWGTMIRENYPYIILDAAHLAIFPGLAIMLMVLAFMIMGNGLRNALDIKISH